MKLPLATSIAADRARVFAALVDPQTLQRAIPGCESLTETAPGEYAATLKVGVAGLKGSYKGKTTVSHQQPPDSLFLSFEGRGAPGFVRGSAWLALAAEGDGTKITGEADVVVGGLIASVGSRLIEAAAKKLSDDFFRQLAKVLTDQTADAR